MQTENIQKLINIMLIEYNLSKEIKKISTKKTLTFCHGFRMLESLRLSIPAKYVSGSTCLSVASVSSFSSQNYHISKC